MSHDSYDEPWIDAVQEPEEIDNHLREENHAGVKTSSLNELVQV